MHLTTEDEIALLSNLPIDKKNITAEACVHHLFYSEADYEELGHQIKCNPSIKSETDRQALLRALKDGTIDMDEFAGVHDIIVKVRCAEGRRAFYSSPRHSR